MGIADRLQPTTASATGTAAGGRSRAVQILILVLRWWLVLEFLGAAGMKLTGSPASVALFGAVGLGQWFRYAVASCELTGAALLAYPRTTQIGALALSALMLGAGSTEVFILDRLPLSSGATLLALLLLVALLRSNARRPEARPTVATPAPPA